MERERKMNILKLYEVIFFTITYYLTFSFLEGKRTSVWLPRCLPPRLTVLLAFKFWGNSVDDICAHILYPAGSLCV